MKQLSEDIYKSHIGEIRIIADGERLCFLDFKDNAERIERLLGRRYGAFRISRQANVLNMQSRMQRYFDGDWQAFEGLTAEQLATGGSDFQERVWDALKTIAVGKTLSYSQLSSAIKRPTAVRAVANANANNPLAIIIPCHRVIGKDGSLRGYAGGEYRKNWLLHHEGCPV